MGSIIALLLKAPKLLKILISWGPALLEVSKELEEMSGKKDFASIKGAIVAIFGVVVTAGGWLEKDKLALVTQNLDGIVMALGALWACGGTLLSAFGFRRAIAAAHKEAAEAKQIAKGAQSGS